MGPKQNILTMLPLAGIILFCLLIGKSISAMPLVPLVIVLSIVLFFFAFAYTEQAMILLIFAMLLSPELQVGAVSNRQNIIIRVDDIFIVVFMLAWLGRMTLTKSQRVINNLSINRFILMYACAFVFSTLKGMIMGNIVPLKGFFYVFKYIEYFMVFYLTAGVIKSKEQVANYMKAFILVLVIVNIYACTQIGAERVSAPFEGEPGEPNTLGGYQVLALGIILGLLTHVQSLPKKWVLIAIVGLTMVPFAFTESRASYVAMVVMYGAMIFFNRGTRKNILIGALIVVVVASFFFFPSVVKERIMYTFKPEYNESIVPVKIGAVTLDPSASARINDYVRLLDLWKKKPLMGHGVTGGGFVDGQYISVLVESGLLGLVAFILLLWNLVRQALRIYKNTKDVFLQGVAVGFLAGTFGMIAHALTANTFIIIRIMEPFWFLAAIVMMIPKLEEPKQSVVAKPKAEGPYILNANFLLRNTQ